MISTLYAGKTIQDDCGVKENEWFVEPPAGFTHTWKTGNDLELNSLFAEAGVIYLLHQIISDGEKKVVAGVPNNGKMRIWHNGNFLHETTAVTALRPNLGNGNALGDLSNYKTLTLNKGWNQFLIKIERHAVPQEAHFVLGGIHPGCEKNHGVTIFGIDQSRFIWETD
jgi:hypothetical protein